MINTARLADTVANDCFHASLEFIDNLEALIELAKDDQRISIAIPMGNNINANNAYRLMLKPHVPIIDVRSVQEYQFVGHIPGSYNIPLYNWADRWDTRRNNFALVRNETFVRDFLKIFPEKDDHYISICRSGHRSKEAVELIVRHGYTKIYNVWEGFEGIAVQDKSLPTYGLKKVDGWINKGLPFT